MNTASLPARTPGNSAPSLLLPALLACYLVWGSTYLAIRFALASFAPFFQMGTRFLVAGGLLMAWVLWRARRGADIQFSDGVQHEDIGICEDVQRGMASGSYVPGRLNPLRETGVHHFHELLRAAYRGPAADAATGPAGGTANGRA